MRTSINGQVQPEDAGARLTAWGLGSKEKPPPRSSRLARGCRSPTALLSKTQALETGWGNTTWTHFLPQKSEQMLPQRESQGSV